MTEATVIHTHEIPAEDRMRSLLELHRRGMVNSSVMLSCLNIPRAARDICSAVELHRNGGLDDDSLVKYLDNISRQTESGGCATFFILPDSKTTSPREFLADGPGVTIPFPRDMTLPPARAGVVPTVIDLGVRVRCEANGEYQPYWLLPHEKSAKAPIDATFIDFRTPQPKLESARFACVIGREYQDSLKVALLNRSRSPYTISAGDVLFHVVRRDLGSVSVVVVNDDDRAFMPSAASAAARLLECKESPCVVAEEMLAPTQPAESANLTALSAPPATETPSTFKDIVCDAAKRAAVAAIEAAVMSTIRSVIEDAAIAAIKSVFSLGLSSAADITDAVTEAVMAAVEAAIKTAIEVAIEDAAIAAVDAARQEIRKDIEDELAKIKAAASSVLDSSRIAISTAAVAVATASNAITHSTEIETIEAELRTAKDYLEKAAERVEAAVLRR